MKILNGSCVFILRGILFNEQMKSNNDYSTERFLAWKMNDLTAINESGRIVSAEAKLFVSFFCSFVSENRTKWYRISKIGMLWRYTADEDWHVMDKYIV